jgi:hypothetical protein
MVVTQEALQVDQVLMDMELHREHMECRSPDTEQATAADSPEDLR